MTSPPMVESPLFVNNMAISGYGGLPIMALIRQAGGAGMLLFLHSALGVLIVRQRSSGYDGVDGSALIQVLFTVVSFLYVFGYLSSAQNRDARGRLWRSPNIFLLAYIVLCITSALWSPIPLYTAFMAFQCLVMLLLVVSAFGELNRRCSAQDIIEWSMLWIVWTIGCSILLQVKLGGLSRLLYPFGAARLATGVFFYLGIILCKRRALGWLVAVFTILSLSNKNYFGIAAGLFCGAMLGDRKAKAISVLCFLVLLMGIAFIGFTGVVQNTLFHGREGVGWEYTSGRDKIWTMSWELCMKQPLVGYGFVAGERDILMKTRGASVISTHSMFFSAFLGVGFAGPLLLLLYFVRMAMLCASRAIYNHWRFPFVATIGMVFVISMTAPGLGSRVYGAWLPSVVVMVMMSTLCERSIMEQWAWWASHNGSSANSLENQSAGQRF